MRRIPLLVLVCAAACPLATADELDRFGNPLPKSAVARLGFVRTGSSSPLNVADGPLAAFSPDGRRFATACYNRIHVWDTKTGRVERRFQVGDLHVNRVAFADEGKTLLALERSGRLHAWELDTGRAIQRDVKEMLLWGTTVLSPSGRWLIDARGDVWDVPAGKKVAGPLPIGKAQLSAAFTPDESRLFLASWERNNGKDEYRLEEWDVASGKGLGVIEGFRGTSIACAPDGRTLAAVLMIPDATEINKRTWTIVLFDTKAGREVLRLPEAKDHFERPVFSADGKRFAAAGGREALHVWDAATGKTLHTWPYRHDHLRWLAFSPDGASLGACGEFGTAVLWDVATGRPRMLSEEFPYRVTDLLFSADGKQLVVGHSDGSIRFWDVAKQEVLHRFRHGESPAYSAVTDLAWAGGSDALIFRSHVQAPAEFRVLDWKAGRDTPLSLGKGAEIQALSVRGRTLIVGPPQAGQRDYQWQPLSPEKLQAARREASSRPELKDFRVLTPAPVREQNRTAFLGFGKGEHVVPTRTVALSPDGNCIVESVSTLAGRPDTGMGTYWMPNGLRLVDITTGRAVREFPRIHRAPVFTPDGRGLAWWGEGDKGNELELVESRSGKPRWRVTLRKPVGTAAFSPCGRWLAVLEHEGDALHLLDATTGKRSAELKPGRLYNGMDPLAFSPDSRLLARSEADGTVLLWRVPVSPPRKGSELSAEELADAWRDLASADAAVAFAALLRLADAPKSALPMLRRELLREDARARIERLLADLDSDEFDERQRATRGLEELGPVARPYLAKALQSGPSLDVRRRLEKLLAALDDPFATPAGMRTLRAMETLERIGSPEARRVLEALADGSPEDPLCREARLAVERLKR